MKKVRIKINHYTKNVGEDDLIVDDGACIQVPTQYGKRNKYFYDPLFMSKKLFSQLKNFGLIFIDKERTERANKQLVVYS